MPRLEIQALDFDVLFIGGLIDGEFPRASAKDIFFSDPVREKIGLVAAEELLDQDRFIFYCLLDSSANKVMLTYPRFEGDRALVPSTFLADLEAIAGITKHEGNHIPDDHALVYSGQRWRGQGPAGACERQRTLFNMRSRDRQSRFNPNPPSPAEIVPQFYTKIYRALERLI